MTRFGNRGGGAPAQAAPRGRFAGVNPAGNRFPLLPLGRHLLEVVETRRATQRGDTFVADVKILESEEPDVKEGTMYSWVQSMKDTYNVGAGKVMAFAAACGGLDEAGVEEMIAEADQGQSVVDAACGVAVPKYGENPLAGCKVEVQVAKGKDVTRQGQPTGDWYRDCAFTPHDEAEEQAAAQ